MYFRKRIGGISGLIIIVIYLFGYAPNKSFMNCENSVCSITTKTIVGKIVSKRTFDISIVKSFYLDRYHTSHHGYKYYVYAQTHNGQKFRFFENSTRSSSYAKNKIQSLNWAIQNPPVNINIEY